MADTETVQTIVTLPVVPLPDAVLLPGTVATLTLDSNDHGPARPGRRGHSLGAGEHSVFTRFPDAAWHLARHSICCLPWRPETAGPTEFEVTFTPEGEGTRVELEHRNWEAAGDGAAEMRDRYDGGWDIVLAPLVEREGSVGLFV